MFLNRLFHKGAFLFMFFFLCSVFFLKIEVKADPSGFCGGTGEEGSPYEICDWTHLNNVRNHLDAHFILMNDLDEDTNGYDALASATANDGAGWDPIGVNHDGRFMGTFNGDNYTITGLFIDRTYAVGLFGWVGTGEITNVKLVDVDINGVNQIGGLAGTLNGGSISNSSVTGSVSGGWGVGGLLGRLVVDTAVVSNSHFTGTVSGTVEDRGRIGGLIGFSIGGAILNSSSSGEVVSHLSDNTGGLIGDAERSTITNSHSTANVISTGNNVGGLVGNNIVENPDTIISSFATGNVTGVDYVGGLVGYNEEDAIVNSYATGDVDGNDFVGGLVGHNNEGSISNSFSVGSVTGVGENVGGLVGLHTPGTITNSIYDLERSGQSDTGKGVGKTTAEMKNILMYMEMDWDIGVNNVDVNDGYPYLSWQIPGNSPTWYIFEEVVDEEVASTQNDPEDGNTVIDEKLQNTVTNEELAKTGIGISPIFFSALSVLTGTLFLNRYKRFF